MQKCPRSTLFWTGLVKVLRESLLPEKKKAETGYHEAFKKWEDGKCRPVC